MALIYIRLNELYKKGAYMIRTNKPNRITRITFKPVKDADEYVKEFEKIVEERNKLMESKKKPAR